MTLEDSTVIEKVTFVLFNGKQYINFTGDVHIENGIRFYIRKPYNNKECYNIKYIEDTDDNFILI